MIFLNKNIFNGFFFYRKLVIVRHISFEFHFRNNWRNKFSLIDVPPDDRLEPAVILDLLRSWQSTVRFRHQKFFDQILRNRVDRHRPVDVTLYDLESNHLNDLIRSDYFILKYELKNMQITILIFHVFCNKHLASTNIHYYILILQNKYWTFCITVK